MTKFCKTTLGLFLAACSFLTAQTAFAGDQITVYGFTPQEVSQFILAAVYDKGGINIVQNDRGSLVVSVYVDPSTADSYMPMIDIRTNDPKEPIKQVHEHATHAEVRTYYQYLPSLDRGLRVEIRSDLVAGSPRFYEATVSSDYWSVLEIARYLQAHFTGTCGAGLRVRNASNSQLDVVDVLDGSSAAAAGIVAGDRIRIINRTPAEDVSPYQFEKKYLWSDWGKPFSVEAVRRDGTRYHAELKNDYIPAQVERLKKFFGRSDIWQGWSREEVEKNATHFVPATQPGQPAPAPVPIETGLSFDDNGKVTSVTKGSATEKCGLKAGDIITEINLKPYSASAAAQARTDISSRFNKGLSVIFKVRRGSSALVLTLKK